MGYVSFKGRTKTPCATVSGTDGFGGVRLGKLEKMMGSHPLNEFLRNGRCFWIQKYPQAIMFDL